MGRGAAGSRELGGGERRGAGPGREALPARACRPRPRRPGPTLARRTARGRLRGDHAPSPVPRPRRRAHTLSPRATPLGHAPPHPPAPGPGRRPMLPAVASSLPLGSILATWKVSLTFVCYLSSFSSSRPFLPAASGLRVVFHRRAEFRSLRLSDSPTSLPSTPPRASPASLPLPRLRFSVPAALPPYSFPLLVP